MYSQGLPRVGPVKCRSLHDKGEVILAYVLEDGAMKIAHHGVFKLVENGVSVRCRECQQETILTACATLRAHAFS